MINDFNDFCTWMYAVVDDIWLKIAPFFKRPGPPPECPDSELLAMALIGNVAGGMWKPKCSVTGRNTVLVPGDSNTKSLQTPSPRVDASLQPHPAVILQCLDVAQDRQCVIDSLPLPVVQFHLVPFSLASGDWKANGSTFGKVSSKKQTIFGYKLH